MSKAVFSQLIKTFRNRQTIEVKTKNYIWEITRLTGHPFLGTVYRLSKNNKELINYYHNSIGFYDKLMRIAEIKDLEIVTNEIVRK